jgi:competence protein ComEC
LQLKFTIPIYKEAPFVRLLVALVIGILLQWYIQINVLTLCSITIICTLLLLLVPYATKANPITKVTLQGIFIQFLFLLLGCFLVVLKDVRHHHHYFTKKITTSSYKTIISLAEPLSEKTKSYKAIGTVQSVINNDTVLQAYGNVIVYIKKESLIPNLQYGSTIVINKPLQTIKNNGNPGAFDYEQNSLFKNITHQVFLNKSDFSILPYTYIDGFTSFLFKLRNKVLNILDKNITTDKEKGVAEALLIGYRDDLDKDLVQAYSNTGTIHVIAISGLHLGFIYLILVGLFKPFEKRKLTKWIKPIVIIAVLWIFSLLAGGAASILRSAIMFTCIAVGESLKRKTSIYNTLAISAFIILCMNPFNLWDVGFQLSYAAVLSIVIFMQPIYHLFYIKNKWLNWLWKLNAVTLSAQILTIPITIYHFHQFPNLFLITNLIAVPLSSIILGGELLLLCVSWWQPVALFIGGILKWLIRFMDNYIEWCNGFSFAITDYLQMNMLQCYLLFAIIIATAYWLFKKHKPSLFMATGLILAFLGLRVFYQNNINKQQQVVVYNVPNQQAIDFINGNEFSFVGDSVMNEDGFFKNFHLKPARIQLGTKENKVAHTNAKHPLYIFSNKTILLLDDNYKFVANDHFKNIDVAILSKNPRIYIDSLIKTFTIKQLVADASNPAWKVKLWQKDCERLGIPFYNTVTEGAFIQKL